MSLRVKHYRHTVRETDKGAAVEDKNVVRAACNKNLNLSTPVPNQRRSSQKTISDLPNEVLILIFQKLESTDLISGVYHVCKRWRDIASLRSIWSCTQVKASDIKESSILESILSIAPALDTLDLSHSRVTNSTLKALLSTKTSIRHLIIYECFIAKEDSHLLFPVVYHLRENLVSLSLKLSDIFFQRSEKECCLGLMPKLRSLTLAGIVSEHNIIFRLKPDTPLLERLDVMGFKSDYDNITSALFASQLIIQNKGRLKELYLPDMTPICRLDSVKECRFLTTVSLPSLHCVEVLTHLPLIETLMIECNSDAEPPKSWKRPKTLKELILTLREPTRECIRFLKEIKPTSLTIISENLCKELERCISPDVKKLTLRCYELRLRHLTITILRKMALPNLEYLDVRKCFLNRGIPPKILSRLRNAFPHLSVLSDPFRGYQRIRQPWYHVGCFIDVATDFSDDSDVSDTSD